MSWRRIDCVILCSVESMYIEIASDLRLDSLFLLNQTYLEFKIYYPLSQYFEN